MKAVDNANANCEGINDEADYNTKIFSQCEIQSTRIIKKGGN